MKVGHRVETPGGAGVVLSWRSEKVFQPRFETIWWAQVRHDDGRIRTYRHGQVKSERAA